MIHSLPALWNSAHFHFETCAPRGLSSFVQRDGFCFTLIGKTQGRTALHRYTMNPLHSSQNHEISQNLIPALIKCFGIIFIGYIFGRLQILPNHVSKGLSIFVQNLALPVLIFNLVATISFETVNWIFIGSVFVVKATVFFAVALICMILMKPTHVGKAGLYAIVASQSNDFALGYPLLVSLYKNTHSNYSSFLALTGPIQVLAVNPAGFFMLEMSKQTQSDSRSKCGSIIVIIKGTFSNPIVAMTIVGIIWNLAFDHTIPLALTQMIDTISEAFSSAALVLLGHSMAGKISTFRGSFVLAPVLLIFTKNIIFPLVLQRIIVLFSGEADVQETQDLSSLGFLYGTIPCGPAVFVFACQYDISIDVIASTIIFSTLCSAPIMFASATMAILSTEEYENIALYMERIISYISLISLISCLLLLVVFAMGKRWSSSNCSYGVTTYLVLAHLIASVGGFLCFFRDNQSVLYTQYMVACAGIISTRIWTAFLAGLLLLSHWKNIPSILKAKRVVNITGFIASIVVAFLLAGILLIHKKLTGNSNPNFPLGYAEVCLTAVITGLCFLVTSVCLALRHKFKEMADTSAASELLDETARIARADREHNPAKNYRTFESHIDVDTCISGNGDGLNLSNPCCNDGLLCKFRDPENTDDMCTVRRTSINRGNCNCQLHSDSSFGESAEGDASNQSTAEQNVHLAENNRIFGHILLLMILSLSMLVSFFVCLWKLFMEAANGIFIELEFLDVALTYGQGIIYFLIFGLDSAIFKPCEKLRRHFHCWCSSLPFKNSSFPET